MGTAGAIGVLLAFMTTIAFLDYMAVLLVRAEERARERIEQERRRHG